MIAVEHTRVAGRDPRPTTLGPWFEVDTAGRSHAHTISATARRARPTGIRAQGLAQLKRRTDMTINTSGSSYMSNATIMEWMELKTDRLYEKMRGAMDQSNNRVAAEDALNDVKAKLENL